MKMLAGVSYGLKGKLHRHCKHLAKMTVFLYFKTNHSNPLCILELTHPFIMLTGSSDHAWTQLIFYGLKGPFFSKKYALSKSWQIIYLIWIKQFFPVYLHAGFLFLFHYMVVPKEAQPLQVSPISMS